MIAELISIFFNVITPVFATVLTGLVAAKPLQLEARTLSRTAYYILIPSFIFSVLGSAEINPTLVSRMLLFILLVQLAVTLLGYIVAKLLGHSGKMVGAFMVIAVFANVGNFGLPLITFHLGEAAIFAATIYFLGIVVISFVISVAAANWVTGGSLQAVVAVAKTPALLAVPPAILVNVFALPVPLFLTRMTDLLGSAMVPIMLLSLGVQLANTSRIRLDRDIAIASAVRLLGAPIIAILFATPFALTGIERGAGILQAGMPAAVLCSIIALEYDLVPDFVTKTVLFSTIASVITLTFLLAFV